MNTLFRWLGVDYRQWKAVTQTLLRGDFRLPLGQRASSARRVRDVAGAVILFSLFGIGAALIVLLSADILLGATLALAYSSVMVMTVLLSQHGATLLATADYAILGPRPVSSQTFFAIRLTNVLFHALVVTTLVSYPAVLAYAFAPGASASRTLAATAAFYAWALALTLAVVASYSALLRVAGPARFQRAVGYLQVAAGVMTYGGLLVVTRSAGTSLTTSAVLPDAWWLVLVPPAWFASYVELAAGVGNSTTLMRAALSMLALGSLAWALTRKLGLDYARDLAELPQLRQTSDAATPRTPLFGSAEGRAVALLVLAHFRHDMRVRMGLLAIVPLMILYVVVGGSGGQFDLVALSVLLFPAVVTQQFSSSEAYRAAWIYHVTPADRGALVLALKNVAVVYFLAPFLLLVVTLLAWRQGDLGASVVHAGMLGWLAHVALLGALIVHPSLPFASAPDTYRGSGPLLVWMLVVMLGGQGALVVLDRWVYTHASRTAGTLALLAGVSWGLTRLLARRAASRAG